MANTALPHLEERLKALEDALLSSDGEGNVIDSLTSMRNALVNLACKRERVNQVFKRVPEIQEYLKPGFVEEMGDVSAQRDYLLLIKDDIQRMTGQLQRVQELSSVLDSNPIRDFRTLLPKINQLDLKQLDQLDQTDNITAETTQLLNQYNKLTQQLSEHFIQMDNVITNLEMQKIHLQEEEDS